MNIYQLISIIAISFFLNLGWNYFFKKDDKTYSQDNTITHTMENKSGKNTLKYIFTFVAAFPLIMGLWAINHWLTEYNIAKDSSNWQQLPGKILSKGVNYQKQPGQTSTQVAGKTYAPDVEYEFYYNNKTIKWNVITFHNRTSSGNTKVSQDLIDKIPEPGESVVVYFSPEHKKAVLIPGTQGSNYFGLIAGSIFFLIGLIGLKLIYRF